MKEFQPKTFHLPDISGISQKTIENHLSLYQGYVENANLLMKQLKEGNKTSDTANLELAARRYAFNFNGMRNHEAYFNRLEGGSKDFPKDSALEKAMIAEWGSISNWFAEFKAMALIRGIGWVILSRDCETGKLMNTWVEEQEIGQLSCCYPLVALDMWEHAYLMDHTSSEKAAYVQSYLSALNWERVSEEFDECEEEAHQREAREAKDDETNENEAPKE